MQSEESLQNTKMDKNNQRQIRNSTADFLIFTRQNDEDGVAVRIEDENVWLRTEAIAELFQKDRRTIQEHLKNIFAPSELDENSVCRKFRQTADDGKNYQMKFYNLEAINSVGTKNRKSNIHEQQFANAKFMNFKRLDFGNNIEQKSNIN